MMLIGVCARHAWLATILLLMTAAPAKADRVIEFHSNNVQLLRGWDYQLGSRQRTILTAEHFNRWRYGDFFVFVDYIAADGGDETYYLEPTLRLSLGKLTQRKPNNGVLRDVVVALNIEKPKGLDSRLLGGFGIDLNLFGFDYLNGHLFYRDDPELGGSSHQLTVVWKRSFSLGNTRWVTEGFADLATAEGEGSANQLVVPRLLMDIGHSFNSDLSGVYAGLEYSYWHNKFGIDGVTERVPQLQLMWVL